MSRFGNGLDTIVAGLVAVSVLAAMLAISEGPSEEDAVDTQYCHMVHIGKTSGDPDVGWPDYKGIYDKLCDGPRPRRPL